MKYKEIIFYWFPAFGWMVVIFLLSSRQRISVGDSYTTNFIVFKSLHLVEYGILYFLNLRLLMKIAHIKKPGKDQYFHAALYTLIFATIDEFHQTFVPTRQGSLRDVFIDGIGIGLTYAFIKSNFKKLHRLTII